MEPPYLDAGDGQAAEGINKGMKRRWIAGLRLYLGASSVDQMQWEVSLWEEVCPNADDPPDELDEEFWLQLLEPDEAAQGVGPFLAIMDALEQEAPTEDRPNPHAGVRIGEASNPGPPTERWASIGRSGSGAEAASHRASGH
eukprot:16449999-Heterocapsa_arctica.AAC.5